MGKLNKKALFKSVFYLIIFVIATIFLFFLIKNDWNVVDAVKGMVDFIANIAA